MVHWQNVEHILRNGLCCRLHPDYDPNYVEIGHRQLITDRHTYSVKIQNYGTLGEYVPFYFAGHTPMLLKIKSGAENVVKRPQEDIVFLVSNHEVIKAEGLIYFFTDMNAKRALAEHFTNEKDFAKLRWDIIESRYWSNKDGVGRQDFKQAEYLVRNFVPLHCIRGLVVKNSERHDYFEEMIKELGLEIPVYVDKNCKLYY
ncbi:MAG: DUF4433 domain-containing protein [Cyclobacteriaceae bacterium]